MGVGRAVAGQDAGTFGDVPSCPAQTHTELAVGGRGGGVRGERALGTQACALYSAEHAEGTILHYQP